MSALWARLLAWGAFRTLTVKLLGGALRAALADFWTPSGASRRRDEEEAKELRRTDREVRQTVAIAKAKVALLRIQRQAQGGAGAKLKAIRAIAADCLGELANVPVHPTLKKRMRDDVARAQAARRAPAPEVPEDEIGLAPGPEVEEVAEP